MRVGFHRAQIIDRHHLNIGAVRFDDGAQNVASNAAKAIDGYFYGHAAVPFFKPLLRHTIRQTNPALKSWVKKTRRPPSSTSTCLYQRQKATYSIASTSFRNKKVTADDPFTATSSKISKTIITARINAVRLLIHPSLPLCLAIVLLFAH